MKTSTNSTAAPNEAQIEDALRYPGAVVRLGDCLEVLRSMPDNSVDSIVTDPPYGLSNVKPERITEAITAWAAGDRERVPDGRGFMGKAWDSFVPPPAVWDECLRVLKPGGHLVAFAGSRTHDLMGLSIRMAGFEIRDGLAWLYGTGFPKSMDVSKAIDKAAGAERESGRVPAAEVRNPKATGGGLDGTAGGTRPWIEEAMLRGYHEKAGDAPATPEAQHWEGWGTALKPAFEPITLARKPLVGTVADNVLKWGTGALNIDGCRIGDEVRANSPAGGATNNSASIGAGGKEGRQPTSAVGRWPANVVLDEHQAAALDEQSGNRQSRGRAAFDRGGYGGTVGLNRTDRRELGYGDMGGASRFFYCSKASSKERPEADGVKHPTVKPLTLMRWLVRLVTPPGGTVFDPFAGSGTTIEAAMLEGFDAVGVEMEPSYLPLIERRLERATIGSSAPTGGAVH